MIARQREIAMKKPLTDFAGCIVRMPPAVMLLIIIGLAVVVTMAVTGKVSESERQLEAQQNSSGDRADLNTKPVDPKNARTAIYTRTYIPARAKIEEKQIEERQIDQLRAWDDAPSTASDVIGHSAKHAIPEYAQIRQIDLE